MRRNLKQLLIYTLIATMPIYFNVFFSIFTYGIIDYANLIHEICLFNISMCAYTFVTLLYNDLVKIEKYESDLMCILFIAFGTILVYTFFYPRCDLIYPYGKNAIIFWCVIGLTVFDVIMAVRVQKHISEDKTKECKYENKYEDYLLKKIDSKQESNKNQKEEVVVRDSKPVTDILSEMLKNEKETREYFKDLEIEDFEPNTDIFAEMLKNYNETREYFKISKFQSKFSFFVSVFAAIAGFIILAVAIYGIIDNEHLEVSIIAAVSGAITEIASVVVLGIHNKSALQLNYYYDALHENEKLLSAINMADKLNTDKREEMYMEIIRKQINIQSPKKEDNK